MNTEMALILLAEEYAWQRSWLQTLFGYFTRRDCMRAYRQVAGRNLPHVRR